jgi:selenide,water dikinase
MEATEKRRRVMARSVRIGHCVCDPRTSCPCPQLKEKNICTCAGERSAAEDHTGGVFLTRLQKSAGCAGKIGQKDLHEVLSRLPVVSDPRILVGMGTSDDAGVFRVSDEVTLVQTVDVFPPPVDDPFLYGRIAGCNSLSDIYAMGGRPLTALSIISFPLQHLPPDIMGEILRGGMDALEEAGALLLGGHSLESDEITFGYAVTGTIDPSRIVTNAGARPEDLLVLTKPLGTGIVSLAARVGKAADIHTRAAGESMSTLNRGAAEIMVRHGASACTDVTGFGLLGHLAQLVVESGVTAEIWFDAVPVLPGALDYAREGCYSGANERNAEYGAGLTRIDPGLEDAEKAVLFDPQTSGGLLFALPPSSAEAALRELRVGGCRQAAVIGRIAGRSDGLIHVIRREAAKPIVRKEGVPEMAEAKETDCCGDTHETAGAGIQGFRNFMNASLRPGSVDVVTKELIAIALGLAVHCVPCTRAHIAKAKGMGVSAAEMEEAAALAVAFSGCRTMMMWNELKKELLEP